MAGTDSTLRRQAENAYKEAKKDDPNEERASTRQLKADYLAARNTELQSTGQNEQARSWF